MKKQFLKLLLLRLLNSSSFGFLRKFENGKAAQEKRKPRQPFQIDDCRGFPAF